LQSMLHPWGDLHTVPVSVTNNGAGNYTLTWTVPAAVQKYRIKQGDRPIVDWIGFNPKTNTFVGNPDASTNWFAANEVTSGRHGTCPPAPAAAGSRQTCTITGLDAAQSWHFAMKAVVSIESPNRMP
jgi:hypothetical protein